MNILNFLPVVSAVLAVCLTIGGMSAFRNGRQIQLTKFQEETNKALKERTDLLEKKIEDLEKKIVIHEHVIETIIATLKLRGLVVTVDGEMVTISDGTSSTSKRYRPANEPTRPTRTLPKRGSSPEHAS